MTEATIALMSKPPVPGKVKTRLTPYFSIQQATSIYEQLLLHTASWMNELSFNATTVLAIADQLQHPFFDQSMFVGWERYLQQGDDLGQRMGNVVQHYNKPNHPVILVGGDCPGLDAMLVKKVLSVLQDGADAAIVPAEDGGYVLIGQQQYYPCLFENIVWGSERVLQQTLSQLQQGNIRYKLFPPLWDIDRPGDYLRWNNHESTIQRT